MPQEAPELLTIPELAKETGLSRNFLYQRSRLNAIPGQVNLGRYIRVNRSRFYAVLENEGGIPPLSRAEQAAVPA